MKWQNILKLTGGSSVSVFFILALVLNLTGMTHTTPEDQFCTDCYDEIQVNSTVWEIKVEHAGAKDIIFAKKTRSRTRWLNLDKINEFIETSPQIEVEILVPTTKRYSTINHPKFGYLRPLKDGDSLIARKNKYNPNGDRFIVHGKTNGQTIKWGFNMDSLTMDGIVFDPLWKSDKFTLIYDCKDIPKTKHVPKIEQFWAEKNNTFEDKKVYVKEDYEEEICTEIGVKLNGRKIYYKQSDKACLRTENTLCCWLYLDGGWNINSRKGSSRTTIRNGESGSCVDLDANLKIKKSRTDFGVVKI